MSSRGLPPYAPSPRRSRSSPRTSWAKTPASEHTRHTRHFQTCRHVLRRTGCRHLRLDGVPDKPSREDLLNELARLFAQEVRELLSRRAETPPPQDTDRRPASSRNEGR